MAGDEEKKKKKKSKKEKTEGEAPPPPPPEPEPAPAPAPKPPVDDDNDDWLSAACEPDPPAEGPPTDGDGTEETPVEGGPPAEGGEEDVVQLGEGEEGAEPPPPAPKKKPTYFVHWDRRKPRFYDYNFDYGQNYYSNIVSYLNTKDLGSRCNLPGRQTWSQRAVHSSLDRKNQPDVRTQDVLTGVRTSIRDYELSLRTYAREPQY